MNVIPFINKRDDESDFDYHKRLVYGKLGDDFGDKPLSDIDYAELSGYVYGKEYSSDVARRMMYGSKRTLELMPDNIEDAQTESAITALDRKMFEIKQEQVKLSDQRRELNKELTSNARYDHIASVIEQSAKSIPSRVESGDLSISHFGRSTGSERSAILVFSDWHYGMISNNIYNTYDTSVCIDRVSYVVAKAKERIELNECDELHVVVLGDLFHGAIHVGTRVASEELVSDQMMSVSEILAQAIISLSESVSSTYVYTTYGNHGRTIQNKNDSVHRDNMERIVRWWLEWRLKQYNSIKVVEESNTEYLVFNVNGINVCAAHGDIDDVKRSPRLIHTLMNKKLGVDIGYIITGDKHHYERFDELGITSVICGSLCGSDDYANEHRLFSDPSQLLVIVDSEVGVDAEYKIKCK